MESHISSTRFVFPGLKYEDLLIENDDVMKALSRTEKEAKLLRWEPPRPLLQIHAVASEPRLNICPSPPPCREQRIKRAFDVSAKKKTLPYENQEKQPMDMYLSKQLDKAKLEREEREILNGY